MFKLDAGLSASIYVLLVSAAAHLMSVHSGAANKPDYNPAQFLALVMGWIIFFKVYDIYEELKQIKEKLK
jgi:hypothetical protein